MVELGVGLDVLFVDEDFTYFFLHIFEKYSRRWRSSFPLFPAHTLLKIGTLILQETHFLRQFRTNFLRLSIYIRVNVYLFRRIQRNNRRVLLRRATRSGYRPATDIEVSVGFLVLGRGFHG